MATKAAHKRLTKEYVAMQREPPPFVWAAPDEKNILTWNFLIRGPPDSPFAGGEYHGQLMFPAEYPFKPPGIKMLTPSGRFQPDKKICFSMSDFHPGTWNPAWSVATILTGLLSFMLSDEMTTGSITSGDAHKRAFAARSHSWNLTQARFREAFPEYCTPDIRDLPNMGEKERGKPPTGPPEPTTSTPSSSGNATTGSMSATGATSTQLLGLGSLSPSLSRSSSAQPGSALNSLIQQQALGVATGSGVAGAPRQQQQVIPAAAGVSKGLAAAAGVPAKPDDPRGTGAGVTGWAGTWGKLMRDKWPLGLLLAIAYMVSRFTSNS